VVLARYDVEGEEEPAGKLLVEIFQVLDESLPNLHLRLIVAGDVGAM
jgi:hypothetical protein